jgi:hypothetical protein
VYFRPIAQPTSKSPAINNTIHDVETDMIFSMIFGAVP